MRIGDDRSHQTYLDRMIKHVNDVIKRRVLEGFKEEDHGSSNMNNTLFDEVSEHVAFFQDR